MGRNALKDTAIPDVKRDRPQRIAEACNALSRGAPMSLAADVAGVHVSTLQDWLNNEVTGPPLKAARAAAYLAHLDRGTGVSSGPGGSQFWLERQQRAEFGRDPAVIVDQRTQIAALSLDQLGDDELVALQALLRKALPKGGGDG